MGLLSKLFGNKGGLTPSEGNHKIDRNKALGRTTPDIFTPDNPGSMEAMRSGPVVPAPRYFTPEEATALGQLARQKESEAKSSKRAYKHLKRLEESDTTVTKSHYNYARRSASLEAEKVNAKNKYSRRLHALRPQYAQMGQEHDRAKKQADESIAAIKSQF